MITMSGPKALKAAPTRGGACSAAPVGRVGAAWRNSPGVASLLIALALTNPASADPQAIAPGASLTPGQVGHIFDAACAPTAPARLEGQAKDMLEKAFFFATTKEGWASADGQIAVSVSGNPLKATCTLAAPASLIDDGYVLYQSVEAHLAARIDPLPEAEFTDGGLVWSWEASQSAYSVTYLETEGGFRLELASSQ